MSLAPVTSLPDGPPPDTLKSVGAALDLLACFAHDSELGVSDIARRLGIAKSTAHRLLVTLRSRGLIEQNPETGTYRLGLRLCEFGNLARDRRPVRHAIINHLVELRRASGLPVRVGAPDRGDVVHVDHLGSSAAPAFLDDLPRLPLHHSAAGLSVCAFNPGVADVRRRLGFSAGIISSGREFESALAQVRLRGVAVERDGGLPGVTTIAAPIRDHAGVAYLGVGVLVPTADVDGVVERLSRLVELVAGRMSRSAQAMIANGDTPLLPSLLTAI